MNVGDKITTRDGKLLGEVQVVYGLYGLIGQHWYHESDVLVIEKHADASDQTTPQVEPSPVRHIVMDEDECFGRRPTNSTCKRAFRS